MHDFAHTLRVALRSLAKNPRFTLVSVSTLALGIALGTAFFSVYDHILLRPLAYEDGDRLVTVLEPSRSPTSPANFLDLRSNSQSIEHWTAASPWSPVWRGDGAGDGRVEQWQGLMATESLFELLGVDPLFGRTFAEDEERVIVLGYALWQSRFGGENDVVGRTLELDGEMHTVVGVMPEGFLFPPFWATEASFWVPHRDDAPMWQNRGSRFLRVFGRLKDDVGLDSAQAEVDRLAAGLAAQWPEDNTNLRFVVEPLSEPVVEGIRPALGTILFGVGLVLLIACANVTSVGFTRAAERRRELALRRALGARGQELWRQGLAESLWLVTMAGSVGWLLALWMLEALKALAPPDVPRLAEATLDGRVLGFTLLLVLALAGVFAGLLPLSGSFSGFGRHRSLAPDLSGAGSRAGSRGASRSRSLLVTAEVSMALILLLASGLLVRSLLHLWHLDPGIRTEGVLTAHLPFGGTEVAAPEAQNPFFDRLLEHVEGLPGVESAALINHLHLGGDIWGFPYEAEGRPEESASVAPQASHRVVSEDLFQTFGIPIYEGRSFRRTDDAEAPGVILVNRQLAHTIWPGESAVGKRIRGFHGEREWLEVIGVVGDVRQWSLTEEPGPEIYFPYRQNPVSFWTQTSLVVTTEGDEQALLPTLRAGLREIRPELPLARPRTVGEIYGELLWQPRFSVMLLGLFAATALGLAAIGVYGSLAYAAASRRQELGVRIALGAQRSHLVSLLVGRSMRDVGWGVALGLGVAFGIGGVLESQLHGITAQDPTTIAAVATGLGLVAWLASYLPARRASRVDPVRDLRRL